MWRFIYLFALITLPMAGFAQTQSETDDRDYLTAFLEDSFSGEGRKVTVTGFSGALSSVASVQNLTIADDQGVWLTLRDVSLDWSRSSLLSGAVVINSLSAAEISLDRLPAAGSNLPSPEAGTFSLPELPVSIKIGSISAENITLGPTIFGTSVQGQIKASLSLAGGEGKGSLLLERTDQGPNGKISITASYANADKNLMIDLDAKEAAGGLAVGILGIPGAPAVQLKIAGVGPIDGFAADVALSTNDVNRLAGTVKLTGHSDGATGFSTDLAGDLAPLFAPDYAEFFGNAVTLQANGKRWPDGRLDLAKMAVSANSIQLNGALTLDADGLPSRFDLRGQIANKDGKPVLLPLTTKQPVKIASAQVAIGFDAAKGQGWTADLDVASVDQPDFRASHLAMTGSGRISRTAGMQQVGGSIQFTAEGLEPNDAAVAAALGSVIWGDAVVSWREGDGGVSVPKLNISGEDYSASISGKIEGLRRALRISGQLKAKMADISRLSGLANRPLGGSATINVSGSGSPLSGALDLMVEAAGQDLQFGIAELDDLLGGQSNLSIAAVRDTTGMKLRSLKINATSLIAEASGTLATPGSDLQATLNFSDLSLLGKGYGGKIAGQAQFTGTPADGHISFKALGKGLAIGQSEADRLLAGDSNLDLILALKNGIITVDKATLQNPQVVAKATGQGTDQRQTVSLQAKLNNLGVLLPDFPGALTISGKAIQDATGITLDLTGKGPGQIDASAKGKIAAGLRSANLALKGTAQAALANAFINPRVVSGRVGFDMRLIGPIELASLSGPITLIDGRLADPAQNFALQKITGKANLGAGRAALNVTAQVSSGGTLGIDGTASLSAPFPADLTIGLNRITLRDPDLYETTLNGQLTEKGPLLGGGKITGQLTLNETELRVPSTGFGGAGGLPGLAHLNEPSNVRATRDRAGLLAKDSGTGIANGGSFGLDVTLSAPNRLFVRGRGLDAEMGGELRLLGATNAVSPSGAFNLIRGRLDILGKRLNLSEASLQMEGELVPFLRIVASTENDGITSSVEIEGPANAPRVSFTSSPPLPEEEVLAQLLFGQTLQSISALQALQLANAVATLSGKGGEDIVSKLRKSFGLDNLDVKTDAAGDASLTFGKYIGKNAYTEVTVDQMGKSQINLNLDITKSITLRGRASSDNGTGLGIVLEKDY